MHIFNTNFCILTPQTCFKAVTADSTNIILLILKQEINTNNLLSFVFKKQSDLQTNSEASLFIPEPNLENSLEGKETVYKKVAKRDLR